MTDMSKFRLVGHTTLTWTQDIGLLIISIFTIVAMGEEIYAMISHRHIALPDLLLLFIYLEVLAMVAIYLESGKLPVRMPLYIAIVALARYLVLDIKNLDNLRILLVATAVLLIAIAVLVIRFGQLRFPYNEKDK